MRWRVDTIRSPTCFVAKPSIWSATPSSPCLPHYREVVVLCDLCEMSYAEASAQLDCNLGTIRSRLNRAHGLLAKKLETRIQPSGKQAGGIIQGCLL